MFRIIFFKGDYDVQNGSMSSETWFVKLPHGLYKYEITAKNIISLVFHAETKSDDENWW